VTPKKNVAIGQLLPSLQLNAPFWWVGKEDLPAQNAQTKPTIAGGTNEGK
jgi:hypothetical protein